MSIFFFWMRRWSLSVGVINLWHPFASAGNKSGHNGFAITEYRVFLLLINFVCSYLNFTNEIAKFRPRQGSNQIGFIFRFGPKQERFQEHTLVSFVAVVWGRFETWQALWNGTLGLSWASNLSSDDGEENLRKTRCINQVGQQTVGLCCTNSL